MELIAGVDEVGRGPLAGPVMAAADMFYIKIKGVGGHGAAPQGTVDAIVVDMPFGSYQGNSKKALNSAIQIMKESGGHSVKLEGGKEIIDSIEVSIVCNKESINKYLEKGWMIQSSSVTEVPCTWKTQKSTPKCNLKRDKGCSITVPDIMGTKTTYILTKTSADSKDD